MLVLDTRFDRFSRDKYATAIYKKTLKDNGVKVLSCMENIPDTPEGIILESLLEGHESVLFRRTFSKSETRKQNSDSFTTVALIP